MTRRGFFGLLAAALAAKAAPVKAAHVADVEAEVAAVENALVGGYGYVPYNITSSVGVYDGVRWEARWAGQEWVTYTVDGKFYPASSLRGSLGGPPARAGRGSPSSVAPARKVHPETGASHYVVPSRGARIGAIQ